MCILINVNNTAYPSKICQENINNKNSAAQCDICQSWNHMKCNKLNHIDYIYLQGSNDSWYCFSCCSKIFLFLFGTLANFSMTHWNTGLLSSGVSLDSWTHPWWTFPWRTLPRRTLPRQTFLWPDTSLTDTSPTRHIPDEHFPDQTSPDRHFPEQTHPQQTFPRWTLPWRTLPQPDTSQMDISLIRHIPDGHFPDQTHPWRTLPQPDTSLTDTSPTRHIPDRHFPGQTNAQQIFVSIDASHNGHFPDQLNTSNNLKYLKKIYS